MRDEFKHFYPSLGQHRTHQKRNGKHGSFRLALQKKTKRKQMRMGEKSRFSLELNEKPNEGGQFATDFVRLF